MESNSIPLFSYAMRFGSVLFGSVRLEYLSFGIRYFGILPASVHHWIDQCSALNLYFPEMVTYDYRQKKIYNVNPLQTIDDKKKYYRKKLIKSADNDDYQLKRSGPKSWPK